MSPNPLEFSLPDIGCNSCYDYNGFESDNFMDIVLNDHYHVRYTDESMSCVYGIENGFVSLENQDMSMFNTCGLVDENQPLMKAYTKDTNVVGENMMNTQKRNHNEEMKVDNAKELDAGVFEDSSVCDETSVEFPNLDSVSLASLILYSVLLRLV
ncbi:hypothetical protein Tco_0539744 [Tanacetum coccineum]